VSEQLIVITHVNLALVLYGVFGALGFLTIFARMLVRGEQFDLLRTPLALLFCMAFWPVFFVFALWDQS